MVVVDGFSSTVDLHGTRHRCAASLGCPCRNRRVGGRRRLCAFLGSLGCIQGDQAKAGVTDKRHTKHLERLTSVASKLPPVKASRVAACIVYKGRVVSVGVNSKRTDTFQKRFSKNEHAIYLHAEIAAIKAAKKHLSLDELKKSTLYVCRVRFENDDPTPEWGMSKPCEGCRRAIIEYQIHQVVYTLDGGGYEIVESW